MKLKQVSTFRRTVRCQYPSGDKASATELVKFDAEFRYLSREAVSGLPKQLGKDDDQHLLDVVLVGIHGVEDDDGKPLDGKAAAEIVKSDPWYCRATVEEWSSAITGAKEKN